MWVWRYVCAEVMCKTSQLPLLATDSTDFDVRRRGLGSLDALDAWDVSIERGRGWLHRLELWEESETTDVGDGATMTDEYGGRKEVGWMCRARAFCHSGHFEHLPGSWTGIKRVGGSLALMSHGYDVTTHHPGTQQEGRKEWDAGKEVKSEREDMQQLKGCHLGSVHYCVAPHPRPDGTS